MKRRKNGCGTLVCKGKGKPWLAKWKFDGKTYYRSTGETVREKALIKLAEFVKPYQEKTEVEVLNNLVAKAKSADELRTKTDEEIKRLRIDELFEKFESDVRCSDIEPRTKKTYSSYLDSLLKFSKDKVEFIDQVDEEFAKEFLTWVKPRADVTVYNYELLYFRRLWKLYGEEYGCTSNPWMKFEKRKVDKTVTRRAFTETELAKILSVIKTNPQTELFFAVAIYTGLRRGDCSDLKWSNVDFDKHEIVIVPHKVKRHLSGPIHIPIHPTLYAMLEKRRDENDGSSFVIPEWHVSSSILNGRLRTIFKKCGFETQVKNAEGHRKFVLGFHSLRHTFVSMNINGGMNPMLVQKIVGHSTVNMTEHYFHQNMSVIRDGISKMPDLFGTGAKFVETSDLKIEKNLLDEMMKVTGARDATTAIKRLLSAYGSLRSKGTAETKPEVRVA